MGLKATAVVTVIPKTGEELPIAPIIILKFASSVLGPNGIEKPMIEGKAEMQVTASKYVAEIEVADDFGEIGAVIVEIPQGFNEKYIDTVSIDYSPSDRATTTFSCNSWVQPENLIPDRRIFFSTKSYLPAGTPDGLVKLRKEDLANLRGERGGEEDTSERAAFERIYNYDVYNDLGDPERNIELQRPVLGGPNQPYPRRCRTGRRRSVRDPASETRGTGSFYVPRDEAFSEAKESLFPKNPGPTPPLGTKPFDNFTQIDLLFGDGLKNPTPTPDSAPPHPLNPPVLKFPPPEAMKRDKFTWLSDSEFARHTLAGLNPYGIQRVKSLPLMSNLNSAEYGPPESALTSQKITSLLEINFLTAEQAVAQKKLFILDYHDTLMQYVSKVRGVEGTTLYGSRTLFFQNSDDTLTPLAIELTQPPMDDQPQWKQVFSPSKHATENWLWRLAKSHVLAHDSCFHQLVVHWLRTHCAVEPYAIATNRQLSTLHPIYRLLHPHFRFTLRVNSNARAVLINAGGIIESTFSTAKYSMELSSLVYKEEWKFELQALPQDLIHRGMAEWDERAAHGVKLWIEDYPFASDGLTLWDALREWVTDYVKHYYPEGGPVSVKNDVELQAWWKEIKEKGHPDKKGEGMWPNLETQKELIEIVTTIAWVASGHHAAVNFGQYAHAAYFPGRPSIARSNMPPEESEDLIGKPESVLLQSFPSVAQAARVATTMGILSLHSADEEYLGQKMEPSWRDDPAIATAFDKFKKKMGQLEKTIDHKNGDGKFKNRRGAGRVPYEAFKPVSGPGVTGKGVPYSVST